MKLTDLNADEDVVLLGLLREVVQADGQYTDAERSKVDALRESLGPDRFDHAMLDAKRRFTTRDAMKAAAKEVTRAEVRAVIYATLLEVARADGVSRPEEKPLAWLASWWGIKA